MIPGYRDASEETDDTLNNLAGLIIALHDLLLQNSNNSEESQALMAVVNSAHEKAERAMEQHGKEWEIVKNVTAPKSEVTA